MFGDDGRDDDDESDDVVDSADAAADGGDADCFDTKDKRGDDDDEGAENDGHEMPRTSNCRDRQPFHYIVPPSGEGAMSHGLGPINAMPCRCMASPGMRKLNTHGNWRTHT